jgi:hypothetical protein
MAKKKVESIWTKDLTPGIVNFMTQDITPDFSGDMWTKDITRHVIGTLAVFGLVVSSFITTLGVAAVSVNIEMALAQQAAASQTAAAMLAQNTPLPGTAGSIAKPMQQERSIKGMEKGMEPMASSTLGTSTKPTLKEARALFCPKIERSIGRGNSQATTTGEVGQLQRFIANHFNLDPKDVVTGYFGSTTEGYLKKFQESQGIAPAPTVGPLTRAAIARLCNPSGMDPINTKGDMKREGKGVMGSSTMGTTTLPMPPMPPKEIRNGSTTLERVRPMPPMPPQAPTSVAQPVTYVDNTSNAASVIEAVNQISDGYGKLLSASLGLLGL